MRIEAKSSFHKDLKKLYDNQNLLDAVYDVIDEINSCDDLLEISNLKKLRGYKNYYRIRVGSYRIGLKYLDDRITLFCILPRETVYQHFP